MLLAMFPVSRRGGRLLLPHEPPLNVLNQKQCVKSLKANKQNLLRNPWDSGGPQLADTIFWSWYDTKTSGFTPAGTEQFSTYRNAHKVPVRAETING